MLKLISAAAFLVVVTVTTLPSAAGNGNDERGDDERGYANQLLTRLWESGKSNREASEVSWEAAGGQYSENPSLLLAYIANRIKHNQIKDAQIVARRLTEVVPENLKGWELKVWLDALVDDFDQSLVGMRELKRKFDKDNAQTKSQKLQLVRRFGRLVAYMEGPVKDKVNPDTLIVVSDFLVEGLDPELRQAFDEQKQIVVDKFANLQKTKIHKISTEEKKLRVEIETQTVALNQAQANMNQQVSQLIPQMATLQEDANRQTSLILQQIEPMQSDLVRINASIDSGEFELARLNNEYFYLQQISPHHFNIPFVLSAIRNQRFNLSNLYSQGGSVESQLVFAQNRLVQTRRDFDNRIRALENDIKSLEREKKKSQKRLDKLARSPQDSASKIGSVFKNRTSSLTTYDPFPIELFRQDLVNLLSK